MPAGSPEKSERTLLKMAARGEAEAFGILYDRFLDPIYRYVYYRVADQQEAEDLTETIFLKAWEGLPAAHSERMNFRAWLYRIAHNAVVDYYRTRKSKLPLDSVTYLHDGAPTLEKGFQMREEAQELASAIASLPQNLQQVITCRFISGLKHAETAEIMGLNKGHVRVLQHRALAKIRELLHQEGA